ncbi:813_t:CDS:1 [Paraglomus brasilianum]|uniref:813_t:CDS:1 n=1 Tax=Paraglomus brasilianum TaxID=144538 RepID=A0A9N9BIZ4_9GLOM|nr:813_t:CDS:1 [Paraglomus brasilianum]
MGGEQDNVKDSLPAKVEDDADNETTIETKEANVTKQFQKLEVKQSSAKPNEEPTSSPLEQINNSSPTVSQSSEQVADKTSAFIPPSLKSMRGASVFGSGVKFSPAVTNLTRSLTATDLDSVSSTPSKTNIFDVSSKSNVAGKSWLSNDSSRPSSPSSQLSTSPTISPTTAKKRTASEFNEGEESSDDQDGGEQDEGSSLRQSQEIEPPTKLFRTDTALTEPSATLLTGEENEKTIVKTPAKLFWLDNSDWKERGKGPFKLNRKLDNPSSIRLLMWTEGTLRNILNVPLFPDMSISIESKFVRIGAIEEGKPVQLAIKFESVATATEIKEKIMECIEGLKTG